MMNVLLLNGSPHEKGSTYEALTLLKQMFHEKSVTSDIFHIGSKVESCMGCFHCMTSRQCILTDKVNELLKVAENYDGIVVAAPVYFASPAGGAISFLDRLFEAGYEKFMHKPATSFTVARRAGTASSVDVLNKYFLFSNMPIVSTSYLNSIFGRQAEDIHKDKEGQYLLSEIAKNMIWIMQCLQSSQHSGIEYPKATKKYYLRDI